MRKANKVHYKNSFSFFLFFPFSFSLVLSAHVPVTPIDSLRAIITNDYSAVKSVNFERTLIVG